MFAALCRIGGDHGWYTSDLLWRLRGLVDRLVGGPGLRRGRRDPEQVAYGDALDFWRVDRCRAADRELRLRAEMKLPGDAELDFTLAPAGARHAAHPDGALQAPRSARRASTGSA